MSSESKWDNDLYLEGKRLVTQLFMMIKTASLYDANNAAFVNALESLEKDLQAMMQRLGSMTLEVIEDGLFINQEKIKSDLYTQSSFAYLEDDLKNKKLGGVQFTETPTQNDLKQFILTLNKFKAAGEGDAAANFNDLLLQANVNGITVLPWRDRHMAAQVDEKAVATKKASALRNYVRAIEVMKDTISNMQEKKGFDARKAKRIIFNLVQHSYDEGYAFVSLSTIKNYDVYTFHHCVNVAVIAITFGQNLGLSKTQLADLGIGALYHDIGKVDIPKDILNKPGRFTDDEWRIMKSHPVMAIRHLLPLRGATDMDIKKVVPAFEHHRDYDLSGYPAMTIRKPLNFFSKVIAIADTYDAMTSSRVYQKGLLPSEALQFIMKGAGKKFDPVLAKAFVNTMGIFPVGSLVELNSGHLAIVSEVPHNPKKAERPKIMLVRDRQGKDLKGLAVDLDDAKHEKIVIVKAVSPEENKINVAHYLLGN